MLKLPPIPASTLPAATGAVLPTVTRSPLPAAPVESRVVLPWSVLRTAYVLAAVLPRTRIPSSLAPLVKEPPVAAYPIAAVPPDRPVMPEAVNTTAPARADFESSTISRFAAPLPASIASLPAIPAVAPLLPRLKVSLPAPPEIVVAAIAVVPSTVNMSSPLLRPTLRASTVP